MATDVLNRITDETVSLTHDIDFAAWDKYVRSHPHGSLYHLSTWQRLIGDVFHHRPMHLTARETDTNKIAGVLPLFLVQSRLFGRMLVSTPHGAYGGILANSDAVAHAMFRRARAIAEEHNVDFLELRNFRNPVVDDSLIEKDLYVTFRQELFENPELNFQAFPKKTRYEIREGIKNQLEFKIDAIGTNEFYEVFSRSVHNLGTPVFPKRLFVHGQDLFGSDCRIFSVHAGEKVIAAAWTLFYKDEFVPHFAGSIREYNRLSPNNFMYWMLIKFGCENGYKTFDFGRSKQGTGSCAFKKHFGIPMYGLQYQYSLVRQQSMPDYSPLNPKFALSIQLWRKLPLPVTRVIGPMISKHFI
jgi:FemAB-related protein (PEP-CTERM system-associated)